MTTQRNRTFEPSDSATRDAKPYLGALGERVRGARSRRGMTRKALSQATGVSERHLANLESGRGNVSVLVLKQVADALDCPLAELVGDFTTASAEWLLIRSLLENADEHTLQRARRAIADLGGIEPPWLPKPHRESSKSSPPRRVSTCFTERTTRSCTSARRGA